MNTMQARVIRRGIEYRRREAEAFRSGSLERVTLAMTQTDRYMDYLPEKLTILFLAAYIREGRHV